MQSPESLFGDVLKPFSTASVRTDKAHHEQDIGPFQREPTTFADFMMRLNADRYALEILPIDFPRQPLPAGISDPEEPDVESRLSNAS